MYFPGNWWHVGWWLMWIIPVGLLVVIAIFLLRDSPGWWWDRGRDRVMRHERARDILDRRYASGEITKEQYEEMKQVLQR